MARNQLFLSLKNSDDLTEHQTGCTVNNQKRLVLAITKVIIAGKTPCFIITNNQALQSIWITSPLKHFTEDWENTGLYEFVRKLRALLNELKGNDFENIRVIFNQEHFIFCSAPQEQTEWLEFRMPIELDEMNFFFNAMSKLRTLNLEGSGLSWSDVITRT